MRPAAEILCELRARGVEILVAAGKVRLGGPKLALTSELVEEARARKAELLRLCSSDELDTATLPRWGLFAWADVLGPTALRRLPGDPLAAQDLLAFWESATGESIPDGAVHDRLEYGVEVGALVRRDGAYVVSTEIMDPPDVPPWVGAWSSREAVQGALARHEGEMALEELKAVLGTTVAERGFEDLLAAGQVGLQREGRLKLMDLSVASCR